MLYTPAVKAALKFCFQAHEGQADKAGIPYVNHPLHLAEGMATEDETCVALLHDVMEDCGTMPDDLRAIGMSERVVQALMLLTHEDGVPYFDYVRALKDNALARTVKVADLRHNSDLARVDTVKERDRVRLRKYQEARVLLGDLAMSLETPVGAVGVQVNGEPYPFMVRDDTRQGYAYYEEMAGGETDSGDVMVVGRPDNVFCLEVNTLPLAVGDVVSVVYDFGSTLVDWGSDERIVYRTYAHEGFTMGVGLYDDESEAGGGGHAFRFLHDDRSYEIVDDPAQHRFYARQYTISARIAWKAGVSETDATIVSWAAGY